MSATTMAKIVKKDLKLKIYWKTKHHLISDATQPRGGCEAKFCSENSTMARLGLCAGWMKRF